MINQFVFRWRYFLQTESCYSVTSYYVTLSTSFKKDTIPCFSLLLLKAWKTVPLTPIVWRHQSYPTKTESTGFGGDFRDQWRRTGLRLDGNEALWIPTHRQRCTEVHLLLTMPLPNPPSWWRIPHGWLFGNSSSVKAIHCWPHFNWKDIDATSHIDAMPVANSIFFILLEHRATQLQSIPFITLYNFYVFCLDNYYYHYRCILLLKHVL